MTTWSQYETPAERAAYNDGYSAGFQDSTSACEVGWDEAIRLLETAKAILADVRHNAPESIYRDRAVTHYERIKEFLSDGDEEPTEGPDSD